MSSKRRTGGPVSVSLFPFLAVLLCTMGSLIVVLVLVTRQARVLGAREGQSSRENFSRQLEEVRWRIRYLREERQRFQDELAKVRGDLAYIENRARDVRSQLQELAAKLSQLEQFRLDGHRGEKELIDLIAARRGELEKLSEELRRAEAEARSRPPRFVIVPYQGRHGTQRRPIYVECLADRIVLQPENVVLTENDFDGPLGPGNPLAAVIRAVADEHARLYGDSSRPYPLLLVRPDGIAAYYVARQALMDWSAEFGYELVDGEWDIAYPDPNSRLRDRLLAVLDEARDRQKALIAAAPRKYGGIRRGAFDLPGGADPDALGASGYGERGIRWEDSSGGRSPGRPSPGEKSTGGQGVAGSRRSPQEPYSSGAGNSGQEATPNQGGSGFSDTDTISTASARGGPSGTSSGDRATAVPGGAVQRDVPQMEGESGTPSSLANKRGRDWAVPDGRGKSVAVWRPLVADCHADQFILLPETPGQPLVALTFTDGAERAVDDLVGVLWKRIEAWGSAGNHMHWRPRLKIRVWPTGEARFKEIQALLEDSGVEVLREGEIATTAERTLRSTTPR